MAHPTAVLAQFTPYEQGSNAVRNQLYEVLFGPADAVPSTSPVPPLWFLAGLAFLALAWFVGLRMLALRAGSLDRGPDNSFKQAIADASDRISHLVLTIALAFWALALLLGTVIGYGASQISLWLFYVPLSVLLIVGIVFTSRSLALEIARKRETEQALAVSVAQQEYRWTRGQRPHHDAQDSAATDPATAPEPSIEEQQ